MIKRLLFLSLVLCLSKLNTYGIDYIVDISALECPFAKSADQSTKAKEYTAEVDGITWKLTTRKYAYDQTSGFLRVATSTAADNDTQVTFVLSGFKGGVKSVEATCWRTADQKGVASPTLAVSVGTTDFGTKDVLNPETTLAFDGQATGDVVLTFTQQNKNKVYGIYIGKIKILYTANTDITLDETENNNSVLTENINNWVNVSLNRCFTNDGWYTLCLPFNLDSSKITEVFGDETMIEEFTSVTTENGECQLEFSSVSDEIIAGVPYLIKPTKEDINNINFQDVKITSATPNEVEHEGFKFIGTYDATLMKAGGKYKLLGGSDGTVISNVSEEGMLKGTRCYFEFPSSLQGVSKIAIGHPTAIKPAVDNKVEDCNFIYTLQGIKVKNTDRLSSGIYIRNGKKIIVK